MSLLQADVRRLVRAMGDARTAAGVRQNEIAKLVGVPNSMVSNLESGSIADPKLSMLLGYLQVLGHEGLLERVLAAGPARKRAAQSKSGRAAARGAGAS